MHIKNFDPYDFSKKEINGVEVYYKNLPWSPCIHIDVVFNTGAFDDPVGKEGLSHFFEHLIFNGSPTLPDKKIIKEWSKIHALNSWNARTSFEYTNYWLRCPPEKFETVLNGMKDMLFHSYFRPENLEQERKVIIQEAWNKFQNEKYLLYIRECLNNLFNGHIHSRFNSPLGWPETIEKISHEDIISWHKKYYGVGNFFIILAGNIEESHLENIKNFIGNLPKVAKKDTIEYGVISRPLKDRFVKTADEIGEVKEQVEISLFRTAERIPYAKNEISNMFKKLVYDILHEKLRIEKNLCYNVNVGALNGKSFFQVCMNVKTDEKNIEIVEKEFREALDEIKKGKHRDRFDVIKKVRYEQVRSEERLTEDIVGDTINDISRYDGYIITLEEIFKKMEEVKYEDIVEFADWAFDREYLFTEIILPSKK